MVHPVLQDQPAPPICAGLVPNARQKSIGIGSKNHPALRLLLPSRAPLSISASSPRNLSCNPSTLARDLKFFHLFGFRLDRLQPVDMFPWTYHIEAVAEMVREG